MIPVHHSLCLCFTFSARPFKCLSQADDKWTTVTCLRNPEPKQLNLYARTIECSGSGIDFCDCDSMNHFMLFCTAESFACLLIFAPFPINKCIILKRTAFHLQDWFIVTAQTNSFYSLSHHWHVQYLLRASPPDVLYAVIRSSDERTRPLLLLFLFFSPRKWWRLVRAHVESQPTDCCQAGSPKWCFP